MIFDYRVPGLFSEITINPKEFLHSEGGKVDFLQMELCTEMSRFINLFLLKLHLSGNIKCLF